MFDGDGSLDPLLEFLLYSVLALATEWITEDVSRWITVDLWGVITGHPWWTAIIVAGGLLVFLMLGLLVAFVSDTSSAVHAGLQDTLIAPDAVAGPDMLTFRMKELSSMSATGFEQACSDLLTRDGFLSPRRVGGAGGLGVDVTARDRDRRLLILQCRQYQSLVRSGHVQKFNGTARPGRTGGRERGRRVEPCGAGRLVPRRLAAGFRPPHESAVRLRGFAGQPAKRAPRPPSTGISAPVMPRAPGPSRKATASATSWGSHIRCIGCTFTTSASAVAGSGWAAK